MPDVRQDHFWSRVVVGRSNECWPWTGATQDTVGRRGRYKVDGRLKFAYRIAYELTRGPIPPGEFVHHLCENPNCVNPNHLEVISLPEHTRLHLSGKKRPPEVGAAISAVLRVSERNKAAAAKRRGIPRPRYVREKISATKQAKKLGLI